MYRLKRGSGGESAVATWEVLRLSTCCEVRSRFGWAMELEGEK